MQSIQESLRKLGLGEYEAMVYEALLASSPASATSIAKKCDLSRSSVYTTLSALIAKGLVGTTYKNDVKQFVAEDYGALEVLIKKEKEEVERKLRLVAVLKSSLSSFGRQSAELPQIIFFEGQDGLKKIYLTMMRQAPENATLFLLRDEFIWQPEWKFIFGEEWHATIKRWKIEKNIHTKLLVNASSVEKKQSKFYRGKKALAFRFLPRKNSVEGFAQYVIGDTIAILSMEKNNLVGIKIVNSHLAENFRKTFDTLWKGSKE